MSKKALMVTRVWTTGDSALMRSAAAADLSVRTDESTTDGREATDVDGLWCGEEIG
jgi:hypothetical protein